ncbi:uncharacterized protein V6R79_012350 [Siganus canaliculatus]
MAAVGGADLNICRIHWGKKSSEVIDLGEGACQLYRKVPPVHDLLFRKKRERERSGVRRWALTTSRIPEQRDTNSSINSTGLNGGLAPYDTGNGDDWTDQWSLDDLAFWAAKRLVLAVFKALVNRLAGALLDFAKERVIAFYHWMNRRRKCDKKLKTEALLPRLALVTNLRFTPSSSVKIELLNIRALTEKSTFILDHILDKKLDIMCLTETWQQAGVYKALNKACPPGYKYLFKAHGTGRGGGLAIFYRPDLDLFPLPLPTYTTFEALAFSCKPPWSMTLLLIYRPPPKPKASFFQEFQDLLTALCASTSNLVILGDINIHLNNPSCPSASDFLQLLDCFKLTQHVHDPTHLKGNTLDLVITHSAPINNLLVYDLGISDHSVIAMELPFSSPLSKPKRQISFRNIKNIKHDIFAQDLHYLSSTVLPSASEAVDFYNNSLSSLLDLHAPIKTRSVTFARSAPWFTCELRQLKAAGRVLERRFKATGLTVHKLAFKTHQKAYAKALHLARSHFYSRIINNTPGNSKQLFSTVNQLIKPRQSTHTEATEEQCNNFMSFFTSKVDSIRSQLSIPLTPPAAPAPPPVVSRPLLCFPSVTQQDV